MVRTAKEVYLKNFKTLPNLVADRYESVPDFESALKRLKEDEQYAFVWNSQSFDYVLQSDPCAITTIPDYKLTPEYVSMFVQKKSQFKEIFNT